MNQPPSFRSRCYLILVLSVAFFQTTLIAQWQAIGTVTSVEKTTDGVVLTALPARVAVSILAPDVVRVRMTPTGSFAPDSSWAVVKNNFGGQQFAVADSGTFVTLTTSGMVVKIAKHPCRISFLDRNGNVINADDPAKGMEWSGGEVAVWKTMPEDERYYGFGEKAGKLQRRSTMMSNWNSDIPAYTADTDPIYQTIPFFYGIRKTGSYGIFFDNTYYSHFDMGKTNLAEYSFGAEGGEMNYYFFYGPKPSHVLENFAALTGKMPLPPLWSLGYQQCRWSYAPESRVREIASTFRKKKIPCDVIYLDIDYMDGYRCFTWNNKNFPEPKKMVDDLARDGFKIVTIIDPGIKEDSTYWVYKEGLQGDHFAKYPDGKVFLGKVWPGICAFPDFTSSDTRAWWGSLYRNLIATGIKGFWNDMNEPSVFDVPTKTFDLNVRHDDMGLKSDHRKVHNVYGMQMARGTYEGVLKLRPNERPFVLTRADYAGGNRYTAAWTGDNVADWTNLKMAITMCLNVSISGQPFIGADIGGFIGDPSGELYARWLELGIFTPLMRSHSVINAKNKEPWEYGAAYEEINRKSIGMRYQFLPYIYTSFYESSVSGIPMMRPIVFDYSDDGWTYENDGHYLFGKALLVAPVVEEGTTKKDLRLPAGTWYNYYTDEMVSGPKDITVDAPIGNLPLFVKAGSIFPTQPIIQYTDQGKQQPLFLNIYPDSTTASGTMYEDDGISFAYREGAHALRAFSMKPVEGGTEITIAKPEGTYPLPERTVTAIVHHVAASPASVEIDGKKIARNQTAWKYDAKKKVLSVTMKESAEGHQVVFR